MNEMTAMASGPPLPCGDSADAIYCPVFWEQHAELEHARAAFDDLTSQLAEARIALRDTEAERDEARAASLALVAARERVDYYRALIAEILAALGPRPNGISNPQIAKWRKRAGLEG